MAWGNEGEHRAIFHHMEQTELDSIRDPDWATPLMECHTDPVEGYLHTALSSGEVLPFSVALALTYE